MDYLAELLAFLTARLNDDDRVIRKAGRADGDHKLYVLDDDYRHDTIVISGKRAQDEVEAKRRIIERYADNPVNEWPWFPLLELASVYADHPDFRPEWKEE